LLSDGDLIVLSSRFSSKLVGVFAEVIDKAPAAKRDAMDGVDLATKECCS
jgi:hypothetical protein